MKNARLLSTVAATLLLAVGAASAQDVKKDEAPARAPCCAAERPGRKGSPGYEAGCAKCAREEGAGDDWSGAGRRQD